MVDVDGKAKNLDVYASLLCANWGIERHVLIQTCTG